MVLLHGLSGLDLGFRVRKDFLVLTVESVPVGPVGSIVFMTLMVLTGGFCI